MALDWIFTFSIGGLQDSHGWNDGPQSSFQATVCDARENRQKQDVNVSSGKSLQRKPAEPHRCGWSALLQPVGTWLQTRWEVLYVSFKLSSNSRLTYCFVYLSLCRLQTAGYTEEAVSQSPTAGAHSHSHQQCSQRLWNHPVCETASHANRILQPNQSILRGSNRSARIHSPPLHTFANSLFWLLHFFELLFRKILLLSFHVQLITSQL